MHYKPLSSANALYIKKQTILIKTTKLIKMKRFISISLVLFAGMILLASCTKRDYYDDNVGGSETAVVVDYFPDYPFTIIKFESDLTYAVIEHLDDKYPKRGQILDGIFEPGRISTIRNLDFSENIRIKTLENNPTEQDAYDALNDYADEYDRVHGFAALKKDRILSSKGQNSSIRNIIK